MYWAFEFDKAFSSIAGERNYIQTYAYMHKDIDIDMDFSVGLCFIWRIFNVDSWNYNYFYTPCISNVLFVCQEALFLASQRLQAQGKVSLVSFTLFPVFLIQKIGSFRVHIFLPIFFYISYVILFPMTITNKQKYLAFPPVPFLFLAVFKIQTEPKIVLEHIWTIGLLDLVHLVSHVSIPFKRLWNLWGILLSLIVTGLFFKLHEVYIVVSSTSLKCI